MPKTTRTTVHQGRNGQYEVTVPKAMADALELDGEQVAWGIESATKLSLEKIDE